MSDGLKAQHRTAIIATLAANDRVEQAVLFGSRAMGTNTVTSDVDIALFGQQLTLTDQASLAAACEELPMAQSVDLVLHSTIDNPALVEHIRSHGVEWYRRGGGSGVNRCAEQFSKVRALSAPIQTKLEDASARKNWPEHPLGSFVDPKRSICYGIVQPGKPKDCGVRIVRVNNFKNGQIDTRNALRIDPKIEERYQRSRLQGGELLLTLVGTMGLSAIASKELREWNVARAVGVIPLKENVDKRWINFILRSQPSQDFIKTHANTTVQATFNLRDLAQLPIPMPPDNIRLPMSKLLSVLDDKIELNRKTNETLEAMARALFKSWFVDFDPVRAKAEGRPTGLPDEISALFPDSFEDSELGEIPRGWGVKPLSEVASFLNGLALQKHPATSPEDSLPVIKIAELRNGISARTDKASRNIPKKYIVTNGDFLFSWSGSLMAQFWTGGEGALNQHLFKVTSGHYPPWFFAGWVRFHLDEFRRIAASKATTMGHIQRSHLQAATASCPPDAALTGLGAVMEPLVKRGILARLESRSLAEIRDVLLPNLMSGKLRVNATERLFEGEEP